MILVDTSVWVDFFRSGDDMLATLLEEGQVLTHPYIVGELACGNLPSRGQVLADLTALPSAPVAQHPEVLLFIEQHALMGAGVGGSKDKIWLSSPGCATCLANKDSGVISDIPNLMIKFWRNDAALSFSSQNPRPSPSRILYSSVLRGRFSPSRRGARRRSFRTISCSSSSFTLISVRWLPQVFWRRGPWLPILSL